MTKRWRPVRVACRIGWAAVVALVCLPALVGQTPVTKSAVRPCAPVVFEGQVKAGESYERVFAKGMRFVLEALPSGWIVRVLSTSEPRGAHDYAELATPPYRSVSPLLISTDWAFRAQDAIAWNPRRFRYAADRATFAELSAMYAGVMANNVKSASQVAQIVAAQPEAVVRILDARIVPGVADQAKMASMVAEHLGETPYTVDNAASPAPLGKIEEIRFRVELALPAPAVRRGALKNNAAEKSSCKVPTA